MFKRIVTISSFILVFFSFTSCDNSTESELTNKLTVYNNTSGSFEGRIDTKFNGQIRSISIGQTTTYTEIPDGTFTLVVEGNGFFFSSEIQISGGYEMRVAVQGDPPTLVQL